MVKCTKFLLSSVSPIALAAGWYVLDARDMSRERESESDTTTLAIVPLLR